MDVVVVGSQFGDEGKGRFTDYYAEQADAVVRYQAGPHTGHRVVTHAGQFRFVQVPAGVLRGRPCGLGNGCVVDPVALVEEIRGFEQAGLSVDLHIAPTCHVIFPYHRLQDEAMEIWRGAPLRSPATDREASASANRELGSTRRGVGPCREDKIGRIGLRLVDLLDPDSARPRMEKLHALKRRWIATLAPALADDAEAWDVPAITARYLDAVATLSPALDDIPTWLEGLSASGKSVVYEGAQSVMLDIEHGTYPFCSSGYSAGGGVFVGAGIPPGRPLDILAVAKAYTTRVGGGPLATEIEDEDTANAIAERGREYGTVTGRRRRIGWLDLPLLKRSIQLDGVRALCLSCLDVLSDLPTVQVAVAHTVDGRTITTYATEQARVGDFHPVYETFPGWPGFDPDRAAREGLSALPPEARAYLSFIARSLDVEFAAIGVGADRAHTITVTDPFHSRAS
ncbi:adenylosuccinate synthetase [Roseospira visakhapatnamensis]|uniref:Adenylosuccinate synthetase n=1 Tax=Roseospira visakhapatnamensis TaxID=390880 RepID=A0A7W6R9W8_9PROT|nr:adenylosuccinate synthetase [Roseospira visakhapatnamensis]MBB4264578.1 adenylosuccinate synthase [Roseospira visakhapatnamensis]